MSQRRVALELHVVEQFFENVVPLSPLKFKAQELGIFQFGNWVKYYRKVIGAIATGLDSIQENGHAGVQSLHVGLVLGRYQQYEGVVNYVGVSSRYQNLLLQNS